ncbi:MAG: FMN-binding protein [Bacteroidales bacterium]|nr:FMN-binding protein [Bacteroidales bacterium]MCF8350048.1 FMN-binding protein [Bacteroidales bacterium]MCF8375204.1 FMN-binding protein [Bacteroidales bacterium]MCF8400228.1 FMN-binding protein [Bacteroidales bacterium]
MKSVLLTFIMISSLLLPAQDSINYNHRSIGRAIKKLNGLEGKCIDLQTNNADHSLHLNGRFFELLNAEPKKQSLGYLYVGRVYSCRAGGCSLSSKPNEAENTHEYFDYFILFNKECQIKLVKVFNYQATHGYEIGANGWLKQFIGHSPMEKLEVGKQIDAISGATISAYGITNDVQEKSLLLMKILQSRQNQNAKK